MPIYEYECKDCGHTVEAFQKFSDPPLRECDVCKGELRKLISQNSFHLKGSGWYATDYKSPVERHASKRAPEKTPKAEASAEGVKTGEAKD